MDLILGKWVEENLRSLDEANIRSLVDVLDQVIDICLLKKHLEELIKYSRLLYDPNEVIFILFYWPFSLQLVLIF